MFFPPFLVLKERWMDKIAIKGFNFKNVAAKPHILAVHVTLSFVFQNYIQALEINSPVAEWY